MIIVSEPNLNFPSRIHTLFDFFGMKVSKPKISLPDIVIKGHVPYEELIQLYKDASIFAMPSVNDLFPNVFIESMAFKNPCIGSSSAGIPEIIEEDKTGFLVPSNDYKQLADKIMLLLEDENLMKQMGEQGQKRVKKYFTWDLVVKRMDEQFERLYAYMRVRLRNPSFHQPLSFDIWIAPVTDINIVQGKHIEFKPHAFKNFG